MPSLLLFPVVVPHYAAVKSWSPFRLLFPIIAATVTSTAIKASAVATTITVTCCWGDCCGPSCSYCCCQHCCVPSPIAAKALVLSSLLAPSVFCCQYHSRSTATHLHLLKTSGDLERLARIQFIFAMFNFITYLTALDDSTMQ